MSYFSIPLKNLLVILSLLFVVFTTMPMLIPNFEKAISSVEAVDFQEENSSDDNPFKIDFQYKHTNFAAGENNFFFRRNKVKNHYSELNYSAISIAVQSPPPKEKMWCS